MQLAADQRRQPGCNWRLTSAANPDASTEADQYDAAGNRTVITGTTTLSGTVVTTNHFDAADQLNISSVSGQGTTSYTYDGNGNQTGSSGPSGPVANTFNQLNQLVHVTGTGTSLSLVWHGQGDRLRSYEQGTQMWTLQAVSCNARSTWPQLTGRSLATQPPHFGDIVVTPAIYACPGRSE